MSAKTFLFALAASSLVAAAPQRRAGSYGALYFLNNDPSGAQLAAIPMQQDGSISAPNLISTGGKGLHAINATDGSQLGPDSLAGQGAVAVGGGYVFTVSPGSNELSAFTIDPQDPANPKLLGQPISTKGQFPTSVTYSEELKTACVLNSGAVNGVSCFSVSNKGLTALDSAPRSLSPYLNQTTPPKGPPGTASEISFSPTSKTLVVDIKGSAMPNTGAPGTIFVFPVENGTVAEHPVVTQIKDMTGNFGFVFVGSDDKLFMADVGYGGSILDLGANNKLTEVSHIVTNETAACWAAYSQKLGEAYALDAGSPEIAAIDLASGKLARTMEIAEAFAGVFDTVVNGTVAYFLAGSAMIGAVDLTNGATKQMLNLTSGFPTRKNWQGLAMYLPGSA